MDCLQDQVVQSPQMFLSLQVAAAEVEVEPLVVVVVLAVIEQTQHFF
jgi:hypothetical protein